MRARGWIWAAGLGFAVIVGMANLPMRVMLDGAGAAEAGLSARAVNGTVWDGVLQDVRVGSLALGTVEAQLSPLALLRGELAMAFTRQDAAFGALSGQILGGSAAGVQDVNGSVTLGARLGGLSVGQAQLAGVTLRFDRGGRCVEASGSVTAALAAPVAGLNLTQGLSGPLACSGGQAVATLASQSGMETLWLSFGGDGAWQARFKVATSSDPILVSGLAAVGFQPVADGYALSLSGK